MSAVDTPSPDPRRRRDAPCKHAAGGHLQKNGYRRLWTGTRHEYAHRLVLEAALGRPIAPGMVVDHSCRDKQCVAVAHLEEVTPAENSRRWSLSLTHCPNGHPYAENELPNHGRHRYRCKTCRDDAIRRRVERNRDDRP